MNLDSPRTKEYDKSSVSRLESGKTNPRIFTLYRLSEALGVPLDVLMRLDK